MAFDYSTLIDISLLKNASKLNFYIFSTAIFYRLIEEFSTFFPTPPHDMSAGVRCCLLHLNIISIKISLSRAASAAMRQTWGKAIKNRSHVEFKECEECNPSTMKSQREGIASSSVVCAVKNIWDISGHSFHLFRPSCSMLLSIHFSRRQCFRRESTASTSLSLFRLHADRLNEKEWRCEKYIECNRREWGAQSKA